MSDDTPNRVRRLFLKGGAACTLLPIKPGLAETPPARGDYPSALLGNIRNLKIDVPVDVAYPDPSSPGLLVKLGQAVDGGAGPARDIVAFSTLCPHKGYPLIYAPSDKTLNCPEHRSRFDCEKSGMEIWGHASQNLAQFALRVDRRGDIYAEGVDELIYGRISNILT